MLNCYKHCQQSSKRTINRQYMQRTLLTVEEVARYLNVDRFTVYRLVSDKMLPAFKVGNQWRFNRDMVDSWLLSQSNVRETSQGNSTIGVAPESLARKMSSKREVRIRYLAKAVGRLVSDR